MDKQVTFRKAKQDLTQKWCCSLKWLDCYYVPRFACAWEMGETKIFALLKRMAKSLMMPAFHLKNVLWYVYTYMQSLKGQEEVNAVSMVNVDQRLFCPEQLHFFCKVVQREYNIANLYRALIIPCCSTTVLPIV